MVTSPPTTETMRDVFGAVEAEALAAQYAPCRADYIKFAETVLIDENGESVMIALLHRSWIEHICWCEKQGLYAGILAPMGHGKSFQIAVGYPLWKLGLNRNLRISVVSGDDLLAMSRIGSMRQYVEMEGAGGNRTWDVSGNVKHRDLQRGLFHHVFSNVIPDYYRGWTKHGMFIMRDSTSADASLSAYGVMPPKIAIRTDLLIFDDIVNFKNTIEQPALQPKIIEGFHRGWMTRLEPGGFAIYIGTAWTINDLTQEIKINSKWGFLEQKISADFGCIESKNLVTGKTEILPLWEQKWTSEILVEKYNSMGQRRFDQAYRNTPYSLADRTFQNFEKCLLYNVSVKDLIKDGDEVCVFTGCDVSGKKRRGCCLFTLAVVNGKYRVVLDIQVFPGGSMNLRKEVEIAYKRWHVWCGVARAARSLFIVEDNATQDYAVDAVSEVGVPINVITYTTDAASKRSAEMGLPNLDIEYVNGNIVAPMAEHDHRSDPACQCGFCLWIRESTGHPFYETSDTVMAMLFAKSAAGSLSGAKLDDFMAINEEMPRRPMSADRGRPKDFFDADNESGDMDILPRGGERDGMKNW